MLKEEFYNILFGKNMIIYILIYFVILFLNICMFRKNFKIVIDPLYITLIANTSIIFVIIILYIESYIETDLFLQLFFINEIFIFSFKIFLNKKSKKNFSGIKKKEEFNIFYYTHTIFYIFVSCFYFNLMIRGGGFHDKLNVFSGKGILNYFSLVALPGQLILLIIKREIYIMKSKSDIFLFISIFVNFILKGGKADILIMVMYICITYYIMIKEGIYLKYKKYKKIEKRIFVISGIIAYCSFIYINNTKGIFQGIERIFFRIINEADVYYMYYPNSVYSSVPKIEIDAYYLNNIFRPILKRIFLETRATGLGYKIITHIYGIENPNFGPNTRAEIIWQSNLGYFGIIFSIIYGYLFSKVRKLSSKNFKKIYVYVIAIVNIDLLIRDFSLFVAVMINGMLFIFCPIYLISYTIKKMQENGEKNARIGVDNCFNI